MEEIFIQINTCCELPVPLLDALLGAPQGSLLAALVLDDPSPNGSSQGAEGGAGEPHASSVLAGAEANKVGNSTG